MQPYIFTSDGGIIRSDTYWIVIVEAPLGAQWSFNDGVFMPLVKSRQAPPKKPFRRIQFSNIPAGTSVKVLACHDPCEPPMNLDPPPPNAAQSVSTSFARKEWFSLIRAGLAYSVVLPVSAGVGFPTQIRISNVTPSSNIAKRILVFNVSCVTDVANDSVIARMDDTAIVNGVFPSPFYDPTNLLSGGPAPSVTLLTQSASTVAIQNGTAIKVLSTPVAFTEYPFTGPDGFFYELLAGHHITFITGNGVIGNFGAALNNVGLAVTLLWAEVPLNYA